MRRAQEGRNGSKRPAVHASRGVAARKATLKAKADLSSKGSRSQMNGVEMGKRKLAGSVKVGFPSTHAPEARSSMH